MLNTLAKLLRVITALTALFPFSLLPTGAHEECEPGAPRTQSYTWRNVEIVAGGFISGIVFSPIQADLIYARTDIGGAYRWDPARQRWVPLTDWAGPSDWNLLGIESVGVDPIDARRVYLAAGTYSNSWAGNGSILRSADQGRTWQRTDLPFKLGGNEDGRSIGERLAIDPNDNRILYFGTRHNGLWRSSDYGATWTQVKSFPTPGRTDGAGIGFILFDRRTGKSDAPTPTLYAGVDWPGPANLYRSMDGGVTWTVVPGQPTGFLPHHGILASNGKLTLTYGNAPGPNGMSDGAVWQLDTNSAFWIDITPVRPGSTGAGGFGYAGLAADVTHPDTLMVATMDKWSTGDDLYRTTDGGKHWIALKPKSVRDSSLSPYLNWGARSAALGHWMGALAIDPYHPGHVLYGTGATMWGSDDAEHADSGQTTHWTVRARGLEETAVLDLASPPTGPHLLSALGDIGGFRHDDLTISPRRGMFTNPIISSTSSLDFAEQAPRFVARVGNGGPGKRGAYSTDCGTTWIPFAAEPEGGQGSGTIAVAADGGVLLWAPDRTAAHYSRNHGVTWIACEGLPNGAHPVADRADPAVFYALDEGTGQCYVSRDGGAHFTQAGASVPPGRSRLRAIPGCKGDLWLAGGRSGLFHSTDGGASIVRNASVEEAYNLSSGKTAPGGHYPALYLIGKVMDRVAVYRSDDIGMTWVRINDESHQYGGPGVIAGDPRVYGRVYIGTNGRGILYADIASKVER